MKKYRSLIDGVMLLGLLVLTVIAIDPAMYVMPTSLQMVLLGIVIAAIALFLILIWREKPSDEREVQNQASASRAAYVMGSIVLTGAMMYQSFRHHLDPAVPIALLAMLATKILVQRSKDNQ